MYLKEYSWAVCRCRAYCSGAISFVRAFFSILLLPWNHFYNIFIGFYLIACAYMNFHRIHFRFYFILLSMCVCVCIIFFFIFFFLFYVPKTCKRFCVLILKFKYRSRKNSMSLFSVSLFVSHFLCAFFTPCCTDSLAQHDFVEKIHLIYLIALCFWIGRKNDDDSLK